MEERTYGEGFGSGFSRFQDRSGSGGEVDPWSLAVLAGLGLVSINEPAGPGAERTAITAAHAWITACL
jgi:hypothetical protein